jgi:peroxiredoxin
MALNGRMLARIEALEQDRLDDLASEPSPDGPNDDLPLGSVLLDFELPLLAGGLARFSAWRGQRVLLLFLDPRCPHSRALVPDLARLPADGPLPLIVSTGSPADNQQLFHSSSTAWPVLLQEYFEVAVLAQVSATPAGYLVDRSGRTASPLATGLQEVRRLLGLVPARPEPASPLASDWTLHAGDPVVASYGAEQRGLPAGARAPDPRVPLLDGDELSLERFQGQPLLLVFVDPACAASQALLPELIALERHGACPALVLISRGEAAVNRAWAARHGASCPIGLQQAWEASRAFGIVATPVAFLVDRCGMVAASAAVGREAVLALAVGPPG